MRRLPQRAGPRADSRRELASCHKPAPLLLARSNGWMAIGRVVMAEAGTEGRFIRSVVLLDRLSLVAVMLGDLHRGLAARAKEEARPAVSTTGGRA